MEDDLRPEYDLKNLRVRRLGTESKSFAGQAVRSLRNKLLLTFTII